MEKIQAEILREMGSQIDAKVSIYPLTEGKVYVSLPHHVRTDDYKKAFNWLTHIKTTEMGVRP